MDSDIIDDKLTIKNILFTKALPNYKIPIPTAGYKIFPCTDCGDRFLLESSYNHHINRKSLKITYMCKQCKKYFVFNNRCKLLYHIRSHAFKFATIYVSDLNIEPLPIEDFNCLTTKAPVVTREPVDENEKNVTRKCNKCFECNEIIDQVVTLSNALSKHYMRYTNEVHTCPICLFSVPNTCTLSAHIRIHLKIPPFFCPECGIKLSNQQIIYPYHHDCEGFKMMRATIRIQCQLISCNKIVHPSDYMQHIRKHCKKLNVTAHNYEQLNRLQSVKNLVLFICPICPEKLRKHEINFHINKHFKCIIEQNDFQIYTCKICKVTYTDVNSFLKHHIDEHKTNEKTLSKFLSKSDKDNPKGIYRVVKRCDKCLRSFIYRCELKDINILPSECPYKCSKTLTNDDREYEVEDHIIICGLCKDKISKDWKNVKAHFALFHKNHKCLDLKLTMHKIKQNNFGTTLRRDKNVKCSTGIRKKKLKYNVINVPFNNKEENIAGESEDQNEDIHSIRSCKMCNFNCKEKKTFQEHIIIHRDPCMAYQCLECGECFMVKPSFSTHLLLEHDISDINEKHCYNELALSKQLNYNSVEDEPIKENQCTICRDQFDNSNDLEKHFRVHGMAFLMKNKSNSP